MRVCVFCASGTDVAASYYEAARLLGQALGEAGHTLVFGGGALGRMGTLARAAQAAGAPVIGIAPESLFARGIVYQHADELHTATNLAERKTAMISTSDAFIALPGGFGTLDEILDVLCQKILGEHNKPLVLLDTDRFYQPLLQLCEKLYSEHFARDSYRQFYRTGRTPTECLQQLSP